MLPYVYVIGIILILLILLFSSRSQVKAKYDKYTTINNERHLTGADVARIIMDTKNLDLKLAQNPKDLCDAYYPKQKMLLMSSKVCNSASIASVAIVCHELGHATQHKDNTFLYAINTMLSKFTRFTNKLIIPLLIAGLLFYTFKWPTENIGEILCYVALGLFILHALVKILVIPLEFDASKRAIKLIESHKLLTKKELKKSKSLLRTAGQTYIVALFDGFTIPVKKFFRKFK